MNAFNVLFSFDNQLTKQKKNLLVAPESQFLWDVL